MTKIGTSVTEKEERELVDQLIKNIYLFAWTPSDMPGINTKMVIHRLVIHPSIKTMAQRKQKVSEEKSVVIDEEVGKLSDTGFIIKTKYFI